MIKSIKRSLDMGIKIGDIDIAEQSLENEFLVTLVDKYLDWLIANNNLNKPSEEEIQKMREQVLEILQKKYPNSGIEFKK